MFLQQLCGSAGVTYYASSLFNKGGILIDNMNISCVIHRFIHFNFFFPGFPSAIGTSVIATIMVIFNKNIFFLLKTISEFQIN